jgi:ferredoxin
VISREPSHGWIRLIEPACTSCMICARECPTWCISIDSHTEPVEGLPSGVRDPYRECARPLRDRLVTVHVLRHLHRGVSVRCPRVGQ